MSNSTQNKVFVTRCQDARILALTTAQNRQEVFAAINGQRVQNDISFKTKTNKERKKLKWLKKTAQQPIGQTVKYACV